MGVLADKSSAQAKKELDLCAVKHLYGLEAGMAWNAEESESQDHVLNFHSVLNEDFCGTAAADIFEESLLSKLVEGISEHRHLKHYGLRTPGPWRRCRSWSFSFAFDGLNRN